MPRPLRPIDDGLIYHVINRGNNRQDVFHKPADFQAFLAALSELKGLSKDDFASRFCATTCAKVGPAVQQLLFDNSAGSTGCPQPVNKQEALSYVLLAARLGQPGLLGSWGFVRCRNPASPLH
jgi:hypothetical protein